MTDFIVTERFKIAVKIHRPTGYKKISDMEKEILEERPAALCLGL